MNKIRLENKFFFVTKIKLKSNPFLEKHNTNLLLNFSKKNYFYQIIKCYDCNLFLLL